MKQMTKEEALGKCKIYDGNKTPNLLASYEASFVDMAQSEDGVERLNRLVEEFRRSPALKAMSVAGDAFEPIIALVWSRYRRWMDGPHDGDDAKWESDLAEDFTSMIAKEYN